MSSRLRTLKGTRHVVKSRLAAIATLFTLALLLTSVTSGSGGGNTTSATQSETSSVTTSVSTSPAHYTSTSNSTTSNSTTTYASTITSMTSTTPATSTKQTTSPPSTTSVTTPSTSTSVVPGVIYQVDSGTLDSLVNSTSASFLRSVGAAPYFVVVRGVTAVGLVYLTTDVAPTESWGYHGPVGILAFVDTTGVIKALILWSSSEPRASSITPQYLASYAGHSVFDNLTVGEDVLGVTGATFTSVAIAEGVRDGGRIVVNDYAANPLPVIETTTEITSTGQPTTTSTTTHTSTSTSFSSTASTAVSTSSSSATSAATGVSGSSTTSAASSTSRTTATTHHTVPSQTSGLLDSGQFRTSGLILVLFVASVVAYELNSDKLRYGVLCAALVLLGFYAGTMVSITDSVLFISRNFPPLSEYFWYVLYAAVLVTTLVWGRLYCGSICPFGAFTHLLYKVSPLRLVMPKRVQGKLLYLKYIVLALVVLAVANGALWATGIEPFLTFFFFEGTGWMWTVVGVAVALSVPYDRFYCSYVCPAGAGLAIAARLRIREINRWSECTTCKVCERGCPSGAISGGKISALECMNCRTCEVNYLSPSICPHYALQRAESQGRGESSTGAPTTAALVFSDENRTLS